MGFFDKLKAGLQKTKEVLLAPIDNLFSSYDRVDEDFYEELCDLLIMADVGAGSSMEIVDRLRETLKEKKIKDTSAAKTEFIEILIDTVGEGEELVLSNGLSVILVIGVNGVGKTTSIGKIAAYLKKNGKKVMLAAADTFRAAAIDQLEVWAERSGVPLIRQNEGADPAAVVFDALSAAKKQNIDVLIVDTAGRLHNKKNLLDELAKINRVIDRELPGVARETLLVLDASTGQNALIQAKEFGKAASITGIVLTKLDGTAKGGIMLSIKRELGIPVKFIGVGEGIDDLQPFDAGQFVQAFFE
ncbi:MAG: signal recognition particle-docking protein FtsY [Eubacteriales bacterium]|nr:signal recognition particle-docking protein FtsY [Eubacteriales bacterium]MDD4422451.1 signal recognition particle-docking protein FtsY [Eubacteriales bacterium]HBR32888.1 signal recognition particle-docking protein FtsY [Clostridiales bacterium]